MLGKAKINTIKTSKMISKVKMYGRHRTWIVPDNPWVHQNEKQNEVALSIEELLKWAAELILVKLTPNSFISVAILRGKVRVALRV